MELIMAGNGGARPGAGRKKGSRAVRKVPAATINAGILPLEMRLITARKMWAEAVDESGEIANMAKAKEAAEFAKEALPYTSPRLNAIQHTGANGGPIQTTDATRQNIVAKVAALLAG